MSQRSILCLEDDQSQKIILMAAIQERFGNLSVYSEVPEALRVARRHAFDLRIVDNGVFRRPGDYDEAGDLRFIRAVRRRVSRTMPIIVATSTSAPSILGPVFDAGADDFVLKSEGIKRLRTRVQHWLEGLPYGQADLEEKRNRVLFALGVRSPRQGTPPSTPVTATKPEVEPRTKPGAEPEDEIVFF
jgi:DNA-binding NarL/FixJ family response regulator